MNGKSFFIRRYCYLIFVNGCGGLGDDGEIFIISYCVIVYNV